MRDVMKARYVKSPKLLLRAFQSNTQRSGHKAEGAALRPKMKKMKKNL